MQILHVRHQMKLHSLRAGTGLPLLLLHSLHGSSKDWPVREIPWAGPIFGLDFPGHGESEWLTGGAYSPEYLAASADLALQHVERAAVAGSGLGAYVALLLAGGRPEHVVASLHLPGAGLAGAGAQPDHTRALLDLTEIDRGHRETSASDPLVATLDQFFRPAEYAEMFAAAARAPVFVEDGSSRPPWWEAARKTAGRVVEGGLNEGVSSLSKLIE